MKDTLFALASAIVLTTVRANIWMSPSHVYIPVAALVAGFFALGGMRRPWIFLAIALTVAIVSPTVFDSNADDLFSGCMALGYILGTIAGCAIRAVKRKRP